MADRKISDLSALTTPASGDYVPIVDISEVAAASKNKRITIEELMRGMPDGTAAAPGIAFETDPNTGIYSPGADQLAVSTGGTGRLFVDASGSVGIGTGSPVTRLHVADGQIKVANSGAINPTVIFTGSSAGASGFQVGQRYNAQELFIYDTAAASDRVVITSAGDIEVADAGDITVGSSTGTKIGTATTQKIGLWNATPVVQPAAVANIAVTFTANAPAAADGALTVADGSVPTVTELLEYCVELEAKVEDLLGKLRTVGIIAT